MSHCNHSCRRLLAGLVLAVGSICGSASARTTIYVDQGNCPGPGSGTIEDPFCFVQDRINAAGNGDEVVVAPGSYREAINFLGKAIALRSSEGQAVTTLDGAGLDFSILRCINGEGASTILDGFTITNGIEVQGGGMFILSSSPTIRNCTFRANSGFNGEVGFGGATYVDQSSPLIEDCLFDSNEAFDDGGAIYVVQGSPTVDDCIFNSNMANRFAGAIYSIESTLTLTRSSFIGNSTSDGSGGAVYTKDGTTHIEGSLFVANRAESLGGAIFGWLYTPLRAVDTTFIDNYANFGGAINHLGGRTEIGITRCHFESNTSASASFGGGAILFGPATTPVLSDCTFLRNRTTGQGGAIHVGSRSLGGGLRVLNSTFLGNHADVRGGAVHNGSTSCRVLNHWFIGCLFVGNSTEGSGGAVSQCGRFFSHNSVFVANEAGIEGGALFGLTGASTATNSIVWRNAPDQFAGSPLRASYSIVQGGVDERDETFHVLDEDPRFVRMPDPGPDGVWGTEDDDYGDLHARPTSPSIDSSNASIWRDELDYDNDGNFNERIPFDLDWNPRFVDDPDTEDTGLLDCPMMDMGVYEFQAEGGCCSRDPEWICDGDVDGDGQVNPVDSGLVQAAFGSTDEQDVCNYDVDCDGQINPVDSGIVQSLFGTCEEPRTTCP